MNDTLYRLPYSIKHPFTARMFVDEFDIFLSDLFDCNGFMVLCGDFNIDLNYVNNTTNEKFLRSLKMLHLSQLTKHQNM